MNLSLKSLLPARDFGWNRVIATCSLENCHNKLLTRAVPQSRPGIHVGELWYCSPDCFAAAARATLMALTSNRVVEMPRSPRLSLGLAMVSKDYLTADQLRLATIHSRSSGLSLEAALIELGLAAEKQIAAGRAVQWGYPVLAQSVGHIVKTDLPPSLLQACQAAPLHRSASPQRLVLGFVDCVDHSLLQSIEQITGCRAEPCFITRREWEEQTKLATGVPDYEEVQVGSPSTLAHLSRMLGGFVVEVGGREARFSRCRNRVWARVSGKRGVIDLIVPVTDAMRDTAAAPRPAFPGFVSQPAAVPG